MPGFSSNSKSAAHLCPWPCRRPVLPFLSGSSRIVYRLTPKPLDRRFQGISGNNLGVKPTLLTFLPNYLCFSGKNRRNSGVFPKW